MATELPRCWPLRTRLSVLPRLGQGDRGRRPPLASLAPNQPRPARDAARALERGGVAAGQGRVQEGARAQESDPAGGVVHLVVVARRPEKRREPAQEAFLPECHECTAGPTGRRSEEHTSELQSQSNLVCRLLLE